MVCLALLEMQWSVAPDPNHCAEPPFMLWVTWECCIRSICLTSVSNRRDINRSFEMTAVNNHD